MPKPIIQIENLSKKYRIGVKEEGYKTIREAIINGLKAPFNNFKAFSRQTNFDDIENDNEEDDTIWALKDVSFNVYPGEVVGIIGRNGAGKSTLLKILSRITEPSSGLIKLKGRVSSLLEVGTGFHPELTGRENIFLNGTILGMRKAEIKNKFDEIVSFSEIEKFLDTPVKRYSSGMYVRLAFAVAAYLEPEILIVDEVLAVGDAEFQKKCLGKMEDVAKGGRTVLFVSHNIGAIRTLCSKAVLLDNGKMTDIGHTEDVIKRYMSRASNSLAFTVDCPAGQKGTPGVANRLTFWGKGKVPKVQFKMGETWWITLEFEMFSKMPHIIAAIGVLNFENVPMLTYWSNPKDLSPGKYKIDFEFNFPIASTELHFTIGLSTREQAFYQVAGIGHISISEVAVHEQPLRSKGVGILLNTRKYEIERYN